ncbi:MAG: hypothetical protein H6Q35_517 [Proteobacteria bacterium]|nr:hypothetical protein [Pseudomonadota bacterium]
MERLKKSKAINSVHPLMFWIKNEYCYEDNPNDYFVGGRGTSFLFKTDKNFYLITAKHNFDKQDDESIVNQMKNCYILKDYEKTYNCTRVYDFNKENVIKLEYIPIKVSEEHTCIYELCIFRISDNFPNKENCLSYQFPDFSTEDKGFLIGFPKKFKSNNNDIVEYQRAIAPLEIAGMKVNDLLIVYKHNSGIMDLNGFSGGPVVQFNTAKNEYILMGMAILGGNNTITAIPASTIHGVILEFEEKFQC